MLEKHQAALGFENPVDLAKCARLIGNGAQHEGGYDRVKARVGEGQGVGGRVHDLDGHLSLTELGGHVMSRQAAIVQSSLSEQMRSTRNEHVIESVRLPELVAQSLEIVPDSCRQRLVVASDDSLKNVGVVTV